MARAVPGSWEQLCLKVQATPGKVIVSNEALSSFRTASAAAVVADLTEGGAWPIRAVVVVRRLSDLLCSVYSQLARDTLLPTIEMWARVSLGSLLRSQETDPFWWMDSQSVLRTWGNTGAEVVTVAYSRGPELELALLSALGIDDVVSRPFMGRENRSLSAAAIVAWQRFLRTGINGLDPGVKDVLRRWRQNGPAPVQSAIGGRLAFRPEIAELIDAAFPISSPYLAERPESSVIVAARSTLAKRVASTTLVCQPGPESSLVDDLYTDLRDRASEAGVIFP
jgi:hypothetical protein